MTRPADPSGRRALFSGDDGQRPVARHRAPAARGEGRQAMFSAAPATEGAVAVVCSTCGERTNVPALDLWRHLVPSAWVPFRQHSHWMHCPSCGRHAWCDLDWAGVAQAVRRR